MTYVSGLSTPSNVYYFEFDDSHKWGVYSGHGPRVQGWVVPADVAAKIQDDLVGLTGRAREVELFLGEPNDPTPINRVVLLGVGPADNLQRRTLHLVDAARFYLLYAWMCMDVNRRRRVGDKRLVGGSLVDEVPVDTVAYAPWSTNAGEAYKWSSFRDQGLAYLFAERHGRPAAEFEVDDFEMLEVESQIVQEMTNDSEGTTSLGRVIESIPGAGTYVDLDGKVHVFERTPGAERALIDQLPPDLMGHGSLVFVDYGPVRPVNSDTSWRVYVDYEIETLWTFNKTGTTSTAEDVFALDMVLQVTDISLDIPAGAWGAARTVGQGTWITHAEAYAAYGSKTVGTRTLPQITDQIVANHWFGGGLEQYSYDETNDFDPAWSARIAEILRTWSTYFRAKPETWERVRHAWAVRASVWDPSTATRAPSPVYSNYNLVPVNPFVSAETVLFGNNVDDSYPSSGDPASTGRPSGFRVRMIDDELGVFLIERDLARFPGQQSIAPRPVSRIAQISEEDDILMDPALQKMQGDDTWKLAFIISCAPAAPNDLGRMYEIRVSPEQAADAAGILDTEIIAGGVAPDQELRSQLADARVPWISGTESADDIVAAFGADQLDATISLDEPLDLGPINSEQELQPLGNAVAAADLLTKLDRYEGERSVPFNAKLVPLGSITSVVHQVKKNRFVSTIHCDPEPPPYNAVDFLHGAARSYILKEIQARR